MAIIVGFISEKGGTGKTTACYHIAAGLAFTHKKVLVLDADYQRGGITGRFSPDRIEFFADGQVGGTTLFHKFQQLYSAAPLTSDVDIEHWRPNVDFIPADPRLSTVTVDKLPSSNNIKSNNESLLNHLQVIDHVLRSRDADYDYVLIDSHPEVSDVLRAIIYASDFCVSPVKLDRQSSIGVATIIGEINNVNADVEMLQSTIRRDLQYRKTQFAGSIGMMAREWGGGLKQSEQFEYNRLRYTGGVFDTYITGRRWPAACRSGQGACF